MQDQAAFLGIVAAIFLAAGIVKGVIGLGLPTVAIGILAIFMPPWQAAALLIVPSLATNVWQMFAGPALRELLRLLWPLLLGVCLGIWSGAGMMTGAYASFGTLILGILLAIYGLLGLAQVSFSVNRAHTKWVGGGVGLVTGLVAAATGIFQLPAIPYMQAIGLEKDALVQALGLLFTTATVALAFNLANAGFLNASIAWPAVIATITAFAGMMLGQWLRTRMQPETFRRCFFLFMLALGIYLTLSTARKLWM